MSQFVATTTLSLMRSLGSTAERSVHRMQAVLGREFPNGIGLELAESVPRKDGSGIDWYTEREEPLVRLADLPEETAAVYKARLRQSVQAVLRAAAAHDSRGDAAARATATALRNAVTFPGNENVWISGGSARGDGMLVLTAWGYERHDTETSGKGEISEETDKLPPVSPPPPPAPPPRRSWGWLATSLLWLIPIALAGAIAWLLLPACGVALPFGLTTFGKGGGAYCALVAPPPTVDPASLRTKELMAEATVLEEQLRRHLNSCQPPAPAPVKPPPPNVDNLVDREGGVHGKVEVTLAWNGPTDLDLFVKCPDGTLVAPGQPHCGGVSDIDMNWRGHGHDSLTPVEHVRWDNDPPPGHYEIYVRLYDRREDETPSIPFTVFVKKGGTAQPPVQGSLSDTSNSQTQMKVMEFDVP